VPTVSLVCEGFERQAAATGRGLGFDGLPLAVLRGHVDAQSYDEMVRSFVDHTVDEVITGLTAAIPEPVTDAGEPAALDVVACGTIDEIHRTFVSRGWSDGLAIIPPTRARVESFVAVSGYDPWRVLGAARPSGRDLTIWSIAVNAVMAGCDSAQLPVLVAVAEALIDPNYGVEHSGNTTGADALMILNGPVIDDLGFNHGAGALRDGAGAPNTAVARWLRLFLRNVCGFTFDEHDKATFGNSSRVMLAEDEAALAEVGWEPVGAGFGLPAGTDSVTIARMNSGLIIGSVVGSTPHEILPYLADGLARVTGWDLTHVYGLGQGHYRPLLILSPVLARIFGRAGWSKHDVQHALFHQARIPAWRFEKLIGDWSNLTTGRRTLVELAGEGLVPAVFAESSDPDRLVPIVTASDRIVIAVAGDPNRANAYVMSNDGPHGNWTSRRIDRSFSDDLVCRIDNRPACGAEDLDGGEVEVDVARDGV
jgi:hypothetical protein